VDEHPANVGSRARDHLANERTYLAWIRTALSFTALGIAIAKFFETTRSRAEGLLFVVIGMLFLASAIMRYFRNMSDLEAGRFGVHRIGPTVLAAVAVVGSLAVVGLVFL